MLTVVVTLQAVKIAAELICKTLMLSELIFGPLAPHSVVLSGTATEPHACLAGSCRE